MVDSSRHGVCRRYSRRSRDACSMNPKVESEHFHAGKFSVENVRHFLYYIGVQHIARELLEAGIIFLVVFTSLQFSFQNVKIDGRSMWPTLGSVDISFQPDESSCDVQEAQITVGILVEAREHSAKMLRLVEKALHQVALLVYVLVICILPLPIGFRPYYSRRSTPCHILAKRIRIISLIRHHSLALHILYQRLSLRNVVLFTRRQDELQRVAQSVNARMHLRAEPASASA